MFSGVILMQQGLILSHKGTGSLAVFIEIFSALNIQPYIVSSRLMIPEEQFVELMESNNCKYIIMQEEELSYEQLNETHSLKNFDFCISVWEGQRQLMAEVNEKIGANDISASVIKLIQNKYALRKDLYAADLTQVKCYDKYSYMKAEPDTNVIIKPQSGAGALNTRIVNTSSLTKDDFVVEDCISDDLFKEFYKYELFIEQYISGIEFSFEVLMYDGELLFNCEHEKLESIIKDGFITENDVCTPTVSVSDKDLENGTNLIRSMFDRIGVNTGVYHVEMKCADGHWELIEINPRIGGSYIRQSTMESFGIDLLKEWVLTLLKRKVSGETSRQSGTYFQVYYCDPDHEILSVKEANGIPSPYLIDKFLKEGDRTPGGKREIFAGQCLWKTEIDSHIDSIKLLRRDEYLTFDSKKITVLS